MRAIRHVEMNTDESSAAELAPPFVCGPNSVQAKPRKADAVSVPKLSRRPGAPRSPADTDPLTLRAWRSLIGKFRSGSFLPEAEAQRQTLGPRLPHHRHRMSVDEALAGVVLWLAIAGSAFYIGWWFL
jgi:hypothetical protein